MGFPHPLPSKGNRRQREFICLNSTEVFPPILAASCSFMIIFRLQPWGTHHNAGRIEFVRLLKAVCSPFALERSCAQHHASSQATAMHPSWRPNSLLLQHRSRERPADALCLKGNTRDLSRRNAFIQRKLSEKRRRSFQGCASRLCGAGLLIWKSELQTDKLR